MAYTKTKWIDGETKLNAENLNHMEDGIEAANNNVVKKFIQFPSVEVFAYVGSAAIHRFSASLDKFFSGNTGSTTTANYYYFDASGIKVILDRPITEEGYILVMFQMKRKRHPSYKQTSRVSGYRFTHLTNPVDSLVPAAIKGGFWSNSFDFYEATIGQDVINTFKSEWAIPVCVTSFNLSGNICVCQTVKQNRRNSYRGLAIKDSTYMNNTDFYGYERLAFAICKYEPTISAKRMLIGPKTVIKTALIKIGPVGRIEGVKFTMR